MAVTIRVWCCAARALTSITHAIDIPKKEEKNKEINKIKRERKNKGKLLIDFARGFRVDMVSLESVQLL